MPLIKGPFEIKWGSNVIADVEEITVEHTIDSEEYKTLDGRTQEIDGSFKVSATIVLLGTDIPALAALFPQYYVPNGGVLSTGETVSDADGAIDVVPTDCDSAVTYNDLDIISCSNPGRVTRIVNARTKFDATTIDGKIQKVSVKFIGEAAVDEATIQFFKEGTIHVVS